MMLALQHSTLTVIVMYHESLAEYNGVMLSLTFSIILVLSLTFLDIINYSLFILNVGCVFTAQYQILLWTLAWWWRERIASSISRYGHRRCSTLQHHSGLVCEEQLGKKMGWRWIHLSPAGRNIWGLSRNQPQSCFPLGRRSKQVQFGATEAGCCSPPAIEKHLAFCLFWKKIQLN